MYIPEKFKIVPILSDVAMGTTPTTCDSINMKNYHRATFLISLGNTMAGANYTLTCNSGATDAALTSALYFKYAYAGSAGLGTTADVLNADTYVNTLAILHGTYDSWMLVVEVDAADMDVANGEEWLTLSFADAGTTGDLSIFAILEPRYTEAQSATALA